MTIRSFHDLTPCFLWDLIVQIKGCVVFATLPKSSLSSQGAFRLALDVANAFHSWDGGDLPRA